MNDFWNDFGNNRHIRLAATCVLVILSLFLLALTVKAFSNLDRNEYPQTSISIEGVGSATSMPDIAAISFMVQEEASTVAAAQDSTTKRTNSAVTALSALGIADTDVTTASYNVYPQYQYPPCTDAYCPNTPPTIRAYQVSQSITVKVRDTAKVGEVLQALGDAGVQNISGPNFTVDEPEAIRAEARAKAVADAKAKAEALADELGVRLGKVVGFWENSDGYPMYDPMMSKGYGGDAMMSAPTIPMGEGEYEVRVSVTFELK